MIVQAERMPAQSPGESPLSHARKAILFAYGGLRRRVVLFAADLGTLVSHQQHLEGQTATKGNNAELTVIPPVQLDNKVNPPTDSEDQISPSLEQYLSEVL